MDTGENLNRFDFQLSTRMIFGAGSIEQLGELSLPYGKRVFVVSDPGIVEAGHTEKGIAALRSAGQEVQLYDGARENPTTENVEDGLAVAKDFQPDLIVGLGGGSAMDCAKGINFLYSCGGKMQDYWGVGKATHEMLPMIAVPTTAGTGSEMQSFALISDAETHVKMACGDKRAACRIAILDPLLTLTQPEQVTALTGIDAISHAIETFVTTKRNPVSSFFSKEAWRLLASSFERVISNPDDVEARSSMQLGAAMAGLAIENSMLGATHALANPLTAAYGTPHGQAVGVMLPHVIRFNGEEFDFLYRELLLAIDPVNIEQGTGHQSSNLLAEKVTQLVKIAGLETRLASLKVQPEQFPELAENAAKQWTGHFNPRAVNSENLLSLYQQAN